MNEISLKRASNVGGLGLITLMLFSPVMLAGIIGWKEIKVVAVIKKAYSLWKAGNTVWKALSIATGGWGWVISLLAQFGLAYLASQAFSGSWVVGY